MKLGADHLFNIGFCSQYDISTSIRYRSRLGQQITICIHGRNKTTNADIAN